MATPLFQDELYGTERQETALLQRPSSGIGMAPQEPQPSPQAGVGGDISVWQAIKESFKPVAAARAARRKERESKVAEITSFISDVNNLLTITQGMDKGAQSSLINTVAQKWDSVQPGYGETVKAIGNRPSLLTNFEKYLPYLPAPVQALARNRTSDFLRFVGTAEGIKMLNHAADQPELERAAKKRDTLLMGLQKLVPPEKLAAFKDDGVITDAEVMQVQSSLPEALRFTADERSAVQRSPVFWEGSGVLHGDKAQEVLADRAKKAGAPDKAPQTKDIGGMVYAFDPENKLNGKRLGTDSRWVELGPKKGEGEGGPSQQDIVEREFKLSDDYRQDTNKFSPLRAQFESATSYMAQRAKEKTSAGDAALAFAYAKMRDPNDRLAVSETRDLVKLGNIFERVGVNIVGLIEKGETLPDRVANQMYDEILRRFKDLNRAQSKVEEEYRQKTQDYGGKPDRVVRPLAIPGKAFEGLETSSGDVDGANDGAEPSQADLEFTARKHGITVEEVKRRLKGRNGARPSR